jgi:ribulose bisphosphate carboxylase small subunit
MKKTGCFIIVFSLMAMTQLYSQHRVNDIKQYKGWFKINIESDADDNIHYAITQCYPNGDEYVLNDNERKQLPLFMKVFCIGISEEVLKGQMESMTFNEDGIYMRVVGFTLMIDFSKSDDEILESLGGEMVNKYKYKSW